MPYNKTGATCHALLDLRSGGNFVEPLALDRIYGAWWGRNIGTDAKAAFNASVRRYLAAIS
jgi:hypothetical protein